MKVSVLSLLFLTIVLMVGGCDEDENSLAPSEPFDGTANFRVEKL